MMLISREGTNLLLHSSLMSEAIALRAILKHENIGFETAVSAGGFVTIVSKINEGRMRSAVQQWANATASISLALTQDQLDTIEAMRKQRRAERAARGEAP